MTILCAKRTTTFGIPLLALALASAASGATVRKDCERPDPGPGATVKCQQEKLADGTVCEICYDASGSVVSKKCAQPDPGSGPIATCTAETAADGTMCKVCVDASGTI